jgi:hypothetical protein
MFDPHETFMTRRRASAPKADDQIACDRAATI